MNQTLVLLLAGLAAGLIDSIAGGGGLITLPTLGVFLSAGPHAIGTNKIAGSAASLVALLVYARARKPDWKSIARFAAFAAAGSFLGSRVSPLLPREAFKVLLLITGPLVLFLLWRRELWTRVLHTEEHAHPENLQITFRVAVAGLLCGFYDGAWGPGGGTLMLLASLLVAKMPLFTALAASKLANLASASSSLVSYAAQGYVHWAPGAAVGVGISVGSFFGARRASKDAARIIRPVLALVVSALILRILFTG